MEEKAQEEGEAREAAAVGGEGGRAVAAAVWVQEEEGAMAKVVQEVAIAEGAAEEAPKLSLPSVHLLQQPKRIRTLINL